MPTGPRVLFLGHGAERTGPPVFLLRFLRWLATTDAPRPTVVLGRGGELVPAYQDVADVVVATRGAEPLEPLAAALRRAGRPGWAGAAGTRWLRRRLTNLPEPDLVHVNGGSPVTARLLRALPDWPAVPRAVHVHELDIGLRHNLDDADRLLLLAGDHPLFAVCGAVADTLTGGHGVDAGRVSIHPGFVPSSVPAGPAPAAAVAAARHRLGVPAGAFLVGTAALPDWRKAPDLLLRAAWTLRRDRPDVDLHVAWIGGDPAGTDVWQAAHEAAQLGLADRFHHLADQPDPQPLLAALDVYASTAREDAFPLSVLEAASAAVPVVAFATGGVAELVRGGDDDPPAGAVVAFPDTDAFAAALAARHDDAGSRRAEGTTGADRVVARYTDTVCGPALWAALVAAGGGPPA